ncbi:hypothetical protein PAE0476 [Pyrobaculum aerophilum str. IM2]|uniref:Uncharacterized protein n=1 Tax=Pyrobaculum aerophilum (strain ATCC 51768 / DSM 7523 / JCM 9630 / CIP 104966 / NBRC 100827 / IM2) TaxID=178306 RepID=Q8ZZ25_PYRAE|nr:hypothetical protein PAE0476 [Pyrobaculum aerophilum str. IM2]
MPIPDVNKNKAWGACEYVDPVFRLGCMPLAE